MFNTKRINKKQQLHKNYLKFSCFTVHKLFILYSYVPKTITRDWKK